MASLSATDDAHGGVDDRLRRKAMLAAVREAENVAGQVKGADLPAAVGQQLVAPYRAGFDLVDVFGRFLLAVDLGAFFVGKFD